MNLIDLPWLAAPSTSFRSDVQALRAASGADANADANALRRLATARLNLTQLNSLARAIPQPEDAPTLPWIKLAILSNGTVDLLPPALRATAPRHDLWLDVQTGHFGSYVQDAVDPASVINARGNDFVLLALDHRALGVLPCPGAPEQAQAIVQAAFDTIAGLVEGLRSAAGATVIVQTLPALPETLFGSFEMRVPGTAAWLIERINTMLRETPMAGTLLFDVAHLANAVGLSHWHDCALWYTGKFAFSHDVLPLYADHLCRLLMAARGKARKCLVLDLDNTLWGGVIGDDGMANIVLGQGNPVGEAYLAVQAAALALRARGIVLAVSSKNDEAVARRVFKEHPDMLLREEHIAVFQANWQDKASNLRAIAEALNIGLDALVFLDDNPAERQQVRLALPMVAVPEVPEQPEAFASILMAAGYFETVQFTAEDSERAKQYEANAVRRAVLGDASNLEDYLGSLEMVAEISAFDDVGRARIAQLINKTNQFNLTTVRHSEADVALIQDDPARLGLQVRLRDRFGDNGMIGIVICSCQGNDWNIDTWLMSCRVLNRRVEHAVLDTLAGLAQARGGQRLIGIYARTERNQMVSEHYQRLGFTLADSNETGSRWALELAAYQPLQPPIEIRLGPTLLAH
ncbi:HAD-IIIC family phosphatase [Massilia sp. TSP1-1-2]|uniref:HAD-IIIC family phosphatase n=1 Tax=Massilia sp. TSP1-1-2 TaxID=2804649 RepID=UPI003CF69B95